MRNVSRAFAFLFKNTQKYSNNDHLPILIIVQVNHNTFWQQEQPISVNLIVIVMWKMFGYG